MVQGKGTLSTCSKYQNEGGPCEYAPQDIKTLELAVSP